MHGKGKVPGEVITELKLAYPKGKLCKWKSLDGKDEVVFSPLTRKKMDFIRKVITNEAKESSVELINLMIFKECILWPQLTDEEIDSCPMGMVPSLVKVIQESSGYVSVDIYGNVLGPDLYTTILREADFWGDLTEEETTELVSKTHFPLVKVRIDRYIFVIRPMTRTDVLIANQSQLDPQTTMLASVTVWPEAIDWDQIPAGICEVLGRKVSEISGWEVDGQVSEI
mgnify:CR=1 FL=1